MAMRYAPLFQVECLHGYFANRPCPVLTLRPTPACRQLLARYGCLFRPGPGGGMVAWASRDGENLMAAFDEAQPFSFDLISGDPHLLTYTQAEAAATLSPSPLNESLHHFHNLGGHTADDGVCLLHPPGQALSEAPLPVRPKRFTHSLEEPADQPRLEVVSLLGDAVVWQLQRADKAVRAIPLDLSTLPDGRYRLRIDGQDGSPFYLSDAGGAQRWGVLDIYPGGPAQAAQVPAAGQALDAGGQPQPKTYRIRLESRATTWRYHIVSPPAEPQAYAGYQVACLPRSTSRETARQAIDFKETAPTQLDSRPARVFESAQPIPLQEKPFEAYEMVFRPNGQGERSGKAFKLPFARVESTRVEMSGAERRMVSEVYVYL